MVLEVRFLDARVAAVVDGDVGLDALRLDRAPRRRVVARRGELQARVVAERKDRLHRALAEGLRAHDGRALVVLQRAGDDFGGRRGAAVDQHDHRHLLDARRKVPEGILAAARVVLAARREAHLRFGRPPVGVDDENVLRQERGRHGDRLVQQAARIAAQVEHEAGQVARLVHVLQRLGEILGGAVLELAHTDVADAGLDRLRADALDVDFLAREAEREGHLDVLAHDRQHDHRARLAAHLLDGLGERDAAGGEIVDLDDEVAGLDAGAERGRVLDRRHDPDDAVLDADLDPEAAELALRRDLQVLERLGVEEVGMRVEPVHHPVDRFLDQLVVRDRLDVVRLDLAEHRREELQVLVGDRRPHVALRDRGEIERKQEAQHGSQPDQSCFLPVAHIVCPLPAPRTRPPIGARRRGPMSPKYTAPREMSRLTVGALRGRQDRRFDREIGSLRAAGPIMTALELPTGAALRATSGARFAGPRKRLPFAKPR